jgi:outer membrane protein TolC
MRLGSVSLPLLLGLVLGSALDAIASTNTPGNLRPITLEECIAQAISKNLDLQIQQRSLDISGYNLGGAYGAYTPTLSFGARRDFLQQPLSVDYDNAGLNYPYELDRVSLKPALSGRLPLGFSYALSATAQSDDVDTFFGVDTNLISRFPPDGTRSTNNAYADARVTVTQHLLRDFWIDSARQTLLIRRKDFQMSQQTMLMQIMRTVLAVELGYYDVIAARENVRVQEQALGLNERLLKETRRRVEAGDLPEPDALQAQAEVELTRTRLSQAREERVYRQNALKSLITDSFAASVELDLDPMDELPRAEIPVSRSDSFRKAITKRPDLAEARLAVERSAVNVKYQLNQLFPSVDFVGRYGGLGVQPERSDAVEDAFNLRNKEYFYGVVVSIPLGNVAERNSYRASRAQRELSELQLKKAEQDILVQVADFVNRVSSRHEQLKSAQAAREFAEAALTAEEKKLIGGLSTVFIVLRLRETLTGAQLSEVEALVEYNKALAQLSFAEGGTMENHKLLLQSRN